MASTTITDAVVFPQDEGTGVADGSESWDSAGFLGLIASHVGGEYKEGMGLSALDTTNETVDVGAGHCFITESGNQVQSGAASASTPDTTLPSGSDMAYLVVFPTSTTVSLDADTDASLQVVVDPTASDTVTVEHNTTPTTPSVEIGTADSTGGGSGTSESNIDPSLKVANLDIDDGIISAGGQTLIREQFGRIIFSSDGSTNRIVSGGLQIAASSNTSLIIDPGVGDVDIADNPIAMSPQDVRNISSTSQGNVVYHDGSGTNTEGPAHYNGTNWISTVDGTTIS